MEQATQGAAQQRLPRNRGRRTWLSIFPAHLHSTKGPPSSQGQQEKEVQKATSPKTEPQPEKKPEQVPRSHGDVGFQKEPVVPGIVDFELIHEDLKTTKPPTLQPTPGAYRFGRLSHHSFFSRHHPQAQRVTHIQDIAGKPICMVRDEFSLAALTQPSFLTPCVMGMPTVSVPIGDPQSNRKPRLSTSATWRKNLKDLASRVTFFTKEIASTTNEQKDEPPMKDPSPREQGAKYSAETGRLIPAYSHALTRRNRQAQRGHTSGKGGGVQASILQDQELLGGLTAPGVKFSGPVGRGPRAGFLGLHLLPPVPPPPLHSYRQHRQPGLGSPPSTSKKQTEHILPLLDPRPQKKPPAKKAARDGDSQLLHWMEPLTKHLAETTQSGQQAANSESPTSWQTFPDSWSSRVGRPLGYPKSPPKTSQHAGLDPGASLSDSTNRFSKGYPVLAALRSAKRKRFGFGASADGLGSAHPPASPLHPSREAVAPTSRASRPSSRDTTGNLQSIPEEDENTTSIQDRQTRVHGQSPSPPSTSDREPRGENDQAQGLKLRSIAESTETSE
ncbi:protein TBATA isoform X3 [Rattus norvegicus]|uniref:Thymus, brain and testes associated n=1 Tax=Rattus norvegicus TaxID=10116 RepID=A0A8I5YC32_RAT|nr:protein TBATA isoform X3 [Rattus norvegicus]